MTRNQSLSVAGSTRLPRPMICLKSTGEERVFIKTMLRHEGTSTPVDSSSAVVATTGVLRSLSWNWVSQVRASDSSDTMGTA